MLIETRAGKYPTQDRLLWLHDGFSFNVSTLYLICEGTSSNSIYGRRKYRLLPFNFRRRKTRKTVQQSHRYTYLVFMLQLTI